MDLKIKDVAELLSVSTTTIRRWLKEGKIPAYQLHHQYRFSKSEIEDWMLKCKLKLSKDGFSPFEEKQIYPVQEDDPDRSKGGMQMFSLYRAIAKGGVVVEGNGKTKQQFIQDTMRQVAPKLGLDAELLTELLMDREELMPTGLNHGIAVPHTRETVIRPPSSDFVVVAFPKQPLDWGALDGQPVHTALFLFSSTDKTHLHLLSKLAHLSSREDAIRFLSAKPSQEQLLSYVKDWEATIRQ